MKAAKAIGVKGGWLMLSKEASSDLVEGMRGVFGDQLLSVVLYGSVARGDDTPESDVDIALFLREPLRYEEQEKMISCIVDLDWKYDKVFSPIDIQQSMYEEWVEDLPFYRNIREDGIVLWTAAT